MALSQNASKSAAILAKFDKPLGVWIGSNDEVFNPLKVLSCARKAAPVAPTLIEVPGTDHLGILKNGGDYIGSWIDARTGTHSGA